MVNRYINKELNKVAKTYKIKITGLTDVLGTVTELNIKEIFKNFGEIESVEVPKDPMTGQNYGYSIVTYTKKNDAKDAIESMDGFKIKGQKIHVTMIEEDDEVDQGSIKVKVLAPPTITPTSQTPATLCILANNLFDENDHKNPDFDFEDIQTQVLDLCEEFGIVDHIWVDKKSPGNVWIKFNPQSLEGAIKVQEILNKKKFDD